MTGIGSMDNHIGSCLASGCLWRIVSQKNPSDPVNRRVTNASVRETTGCPPVSSIPPSTKRLQKTSRAPTYHLAEGIDADVQLANIDMHSAWRTANDRVLWLATYHRQLPVNSSHDQLITRLTRQFNSELVTQPNLENSASNITIAMNRP